MRKFAHGDRVKVISPAFPHDEDEEYGIVGRVGTICLVYRDECDVYQVRIDPANEDEAVVMKEDPWAFDYDVLEKDIVHLNGIQTLLEML